MKKISLSITTVLLFFCLSAPAAVMAEDLLEGVDIHGVVSQGYLVSDEYNYISNKSKEGSFEYNEVGLNFGKQVTSKLGVGIQFFARDVGDIGNNKITLDWAYADYRFQDWLGLRFGRVKQPVGLWNETRDFDMLRPWIVLPQNSFYKDITRDSFVAVDGLGLYGNIAAGSAGDFDYFVVAGEKGINQDEGGDKALNSGLGGAFTATDVNTSEMYAGNLRWNTPLPGLMIGMFGFGTKIDFGLRTTDGSMTAEMGYDLYFVGFMAEYTWQNLSLWGEYTRAEVDSYFKIMGTTTNEKRHPEAYYLGAAYRFTDWFQLGTYYHINYTDGDDKDGSDLEAQGKPDHMAWEKDFALSLRFDINDYWIFKLEGHQVNGTANVLAVDNPDSDFSKESFSYAAAKLSVSF